MIDKVLIIESLRKLLDSARNRNTNQGIIVYEGSIKSLRDATNEDEILLALEKLNQGLTGIEAHGFFTSEEFGLVKKIRDLSDT